MSASNLNKTYHALLVADSRAKNFDLLDQDKLYTYNVHYVVKPGAKIRDLQRDACAALNSIPQQDTVVLVKVAAGINNLTHKLNCTGCYEITNSGVTPAAIHPQ